jgi:hypothetical protein
MPTSTKQVLRCKAELVKSIIANEYGNIRSILDELLPSPTWDEQVEMTHHLNLHVNGALFEYEASVGWYYDEEGT